MKGGDGKRRDAKWERERLGEGGDNKGEMEMGEMVKGKEGGKGEMIRVKEVGKGEMIRGR